MISFKTYYKLITESEDFTILSSKKFKGENIIKTTLFRYRDGEKYRLVATYLKDPSYSGFVEFTSKSKAIVTFNNIDNYDSLTEFMENHKNDPDAFDFAVILRNEEHRPKEISGAPFDITPFSEPAGLTGMPEVPPTGIPEIPAAPATPFAPPPAPGTPPTGGASATPPAAAPASAPTGTTPITGPVTPMTAT